MASRPDPDVDDDFSDLYKEYTGPQGTKVTNTQDRDNTNKRPNAEIDEEEEQRDPNAVPTDFTSREAKVWEAKSKATERNWKKRKEEEMICKICGESGHFTQGCPSTLGANRKSQDFFERIPARDQHVRSLFTEKVMQRIENDIGCKIKMDEKFIIVSGKDKLILKKGVDAVHKVKDEGDQKGSSSHRSRSRSPERSPMGARLRRPEPQRSHSGPRSEPQRSHSGSRPEPQRSHSSSRPEPQRSHSGSRPEPQRSHSGSRPEPQRSHSGPRPEPQRSHSGSRPEPQRSHTGPRPEPQRSHIGPHNSSNFQPRFSGHDKVLEDRVREDLRKFSRDSPQAYGNDGARSRSSNSRSPRHPRPPYAGNAYNSYVGPNQSLGGYKADAWDTERRASNMQSGHQFEYPAFPQTLEELELEYKREALELGKIRDKEEEEENYKHRETIREMRENYMKNLEELRGLHAKEWADFLKFDAQRRQLQAQQQMSAPGFGAYKQQAYSEYDGSSVNPHYAGGNVPMDLRGRYQPPMENYSRPHDSYGEFQRQRREDFGKTYSNRY